MFVLENYGPAFLIYDLVSVTGCVILLWDHALTFGDELKYIWKRPIEVSKAVFLFNRYFVEGVMCLNVYGEFQVFFSTQGGSYPWLQYC